MSPALIAALIWLIAGNLIAMFPSRSGHWPAAYGLIAIGLPLIAWVFWQDGLLIGAVILIAGASVLRWPLRYLWRWVKGLKSQS